MCQVKRCVFFERDPLALVDFQKAVGDHIALIAPREDSFDFGKQNVDIVRLFDVIVCAEDQAVELVVLLGFGADNDDRRVGVLADFVADRKAVKPRQHNIEDHEPCAFRFKGFQGALAVCAILHGIALRFQEITQQRCHFKVIFYYKNVKHFITPNPITNLVLKANC